MQSILEYKWELYFSSSRNSAPNEDNKVYWLLISGPTHKELESLHSCHNKNKRRRKVTILKYSQSSLFSLRRPASRETVLPEPNQLGLYQSLIDLRERKYPTPVPSSLLCGGREIPNSGSLKDLRPNHRTVECSSPTTPNFTTSVGLLYNNGITAKTAISLRPCLISTFL